MAVVILLPCREYGESWGASSPSPHPFPVGNRTLGSLALNSLHPCDVSSQIAHPRCLLSASASPIGSDGCLLVEKELQKWGFVSFQTRTILSPQSHADKQSLSQVIFVPVFSQGLTSSLPPAAVTAGYLGFILCKGWK